MLRYIIYITLLLNFSTPATSSEKITPRMISDQIDRLDSELDLLDEYLAVRQQTIDSLTLAASDRNHSPASRLEAEMLLADNYSSYQADSALTLYSRGQYFSRLVGNDSLLIKFTLKRATFMPLEGFTKQAEELFLSVDTAGMSRETKILYYDSGRQMYSYISQFYHSSPEESRRAFELSKDFQYRMLPLLDKKSVDYKINLGEYYYTIDDNVRARAVITDLLSNLSDDAPQYARACSILSNIAEEQGNTDERVYYLLLAAIADIRSATRESSSLQELGSILFEKGDVEHAHFYLAQALLNAAECHAELRMIQSAEAIPYIELAHSAQLAQSHRRILAVIILLVIFVVLLIVTLHKLFGKMKQAKSLTIRLEDANKIKDIYISEFLNLCSVYMEKLDQFNKMVSRKLASGSIDELHKLTRSGKFVEEQSEEFYKIFDQAFLTIYPGFVDGVNALLRPDEQIVLRDPDRLNTDLRILAFMRLGINESSHIAKLLNYSLNTIYTYRNKLKNRALDRIAFEDQVMLIPSISERQISA
ncbi:MAG: DUF6377 domain-containing protein [Lachnoclostridium sp.]|nr:DUF6377 domain-containing protein [Lachnoclostridium sp.]